MKQLEYIKEKNILPKSDDSKRMIQLYSSLFPPTFTSNLEVKPNRKNQYKNVLDSTIEENLKIQEDNAELRNAKDLLK